MLLFAIAYADESLHHKEEKMLKISEYLNWKEDYNRIKRFIIKIPLIKNLKKFYELLGVSEADSLESIKKIQRYYKEYHHNTIKEKVCQRNLLILQIKS